MAIDKKEILGFISSEGFSPSGYEEQILNKFAAFVDLINYEPSEAELKAIEEPAPKKSKAKAEEPAE
jgi:hypothetical protein